MPELPEVEACRRLAERHCAGRRILAAQVAEDDSKLALVCRHSLCSSRRVLGFAEVIVGVEPAELQATLQGRTVKATARKGKHMWIDFDSGPSLMLHFGRTFLPPAATVRSKMQSGIRHAFATTEQVWCYQHACCFVSGRCHMTMCMRPAPKLALLLRPLRLNITCDRVTGSSVTLMTSIPNCPFLWHQNLATDEYVHGGPQLQRHQEHAASYTG